ncbi:hypothetical protein C8J57DRAFT_1025149, partial [Mycena rebaudengoi]
DASAWSNTTEAGVKQFTLASMDAMRDWFKVRSPLWSYQLRLKNGFMPTDPRDS